MNKIDYKKILPSWSSYSFWEGMESIPGASFWGRDEQDGRDRNKLDLFTPRIWIPSQTVWQWPTCLSGFISNESYCLLDCFPSIPDCKNIFKNYETVYNVVLFSHFCNVQLCCGHIRCQIKWISEFLSKAACRGYVKVELSQRKQMACRERAEQMTRRLQNAKYTSY